MTEDEDPLPVRVTVNNRGIRRRVKRQCSG